MNELQLKERYRISEIYLRYNFGDKKVIEELITSNLSIVIRDFSWILQEAKRLDALLIQTKSTHDAYR